MIRIKNTVNAKEAINALDFLIDNWDAALEEALAEIAEIGQEVAQQKAKGKIKESIEIKKTKNGFTLTADKEYAGYVEDGHGVIKPRRAKLLKIPIKSGGGGFLRRLVNLILGKKNDGFIYVKSVRPVKPKPFMLPAQKAMERSALKTLESKVKGIIKK